MTNDDGQQPRDEQDHQEWIAEYEQNDKPLYYKKGKEMPKIGEMIESKYLKQSDISDEALVTIQGIKHENIAREDAEPEYKYLIKFTQFKKPMVLNSTNIQLLAKACDSEDTDDWIDRQVVVYVDESVSFGGKLTGGLRIRRAKKKGPSVEDMEDSIPF